MNTADILIIIAVAVILILAIIGIIRTKKKGNSCCGNCSRCSGAKSECKKQ